MNARDLPLTMVRTLLILVAISLAVAVSPLLGQQGQAPARVAETNVAPPATVNPFIRAPRAAPRLDLFQPVLPRNDNTAAGSSAATVQEGGRHTIVISTLALVLAVIIIVLLVV